MQTDEEIQIGLADRHSDEPISGIPIKKRIFHVSQSSSSTCQNIPMMPKNLSELPTKFLLKSECSVSENPAGVKLDSNVSPDDLLGSSIRLPGLDGFPSHVNQKIGLKKGTTGSGESSMHDDLDVDNRASLGFGMEKGKNSSAELESEMLKGKEIVGKIIASSDVTSSEGVETSYLHLSSCQDMQCSRNLPKKVKDEMSSVDLPVANKLEHLHQTSYNNLGSQCASNLYASRGKWDLNFPMEVWDTNLHNLATNHEINNELKLKDLHQPNNDRIPIQNTQETPINFGLGLSIVESHQCNMRFTNLGMPADGTTGYVDGLDLQLRLPSRPKLCNNLGVAPLDLSLSLTGNLSDASITTVKPEPCLNHNQKDTKNHQLSSLNSGVIAQVKSEPCDGSFHETSQIKRPSLDKEVRPELPEEFQVKSPNLVLGNHQLTSLAQLPTALDPNSLCHANILCEPNPTLLIVANTSLDERTCEDLNPSTMMLSKVDDSCINQDARGSSSKPLVNVESILSDVKGCAAEDRVIGVIGGKGSSQHNECVESDPKEPSACDGLLSERRAEMNLPGDEYPVSKFLSNSNLDSDPRKNTIVTGGNQEGMDLSANIQIDQCVVDAEQHGAPEVPKGTGNKATSHGVGDGEDGERQCANVIQCQYKNKLDAKVATASISSEGFPFMTDVHVDMKGKEIQTKVSGNSAVLCHDKRETTSNKPKLPVIMELTASSSNKPVKPCQGTREKHLGKDKVSEVSPSSIEASPVIAKNKNEFVKDKNEYVGGGQMSTKAISIAMKHPELQEGESNVNSPAIKHVCSPFKHSHIKYDDSSCKYREGNKVTSSSTKSFGYRNATSARSVSDGMEKERLIDDNEKHVNLYSQGRRYSKFKTNNRDQTTGQRESDYMNNRRNYNHHFTQDPGIQYGPGLSNPRKSRYMRHNEVTVPFTAPPNGSTCRSLRRMTDYPRDRRFPSWRQSQGPREEPSGRRQIRDIDTNRIVRREIPDYVICEDKITSLPGEIVDNLLHSHSNLHYEQTENDFLSRGNSVSPIRRSPVRLYRSCSPIQWFSPGRTLETYIDDDTDLTTDGPSLDRVGMVRNHPEDEISSRHALLRCPQFQPDMREMHLARELDLARAGRALRNRRYEMRLAENTEYDTEYLEPSYSEDKLVDSRDYDDRHGLVQPRHIASGIDPSRVFPDNAHCPRSREYNDRHGFVQPLRPRHIPSTKDDNLAPVGDVYPRLTKFSPDSEMNRGGCSSRNSRNHVRNRLGPAGANRLKNKVEQEEDYRYHRKQQWCDGAFDNVRLKRRKS